MMTIWTNRIRWCTPRWIFYAVRSAQRICHIINLNCIAFVNQLVPFSLSILTSIVLVFPQASKQGLKFVQYGYNWCIILIKTSLRLTLASCQKLERLQNRSLLLSIKLRNCKKKKVWETHTVIDLLLIYAIKIQKVNRTIRGMMTTK